jgi:hypothetical protein
LKGLQWVRRPGEGMSEFREEWLISQWFGCGGEVLGRRD